jgi:Domain of unknown function (DUF4157)
MASSTAKMRLRCIAGPDVECCKKRLVLQRRATTHDYPSTVPSIVRDVLRSPGQPLDPNTRAFMESRFGEDFHTDGKAAESARAVNAVAYTVAQDVVFDTGRYAPQIAEGEELLAHELAHTIQQKETGCVNPPGPLRVGPIDNALERQAEEAAAFVSQNRYSVTIPAHPSRTISDPISSAEFSIQRACNNPESFYQSSPRFCLDTKYSPTTHAGKRCYREIIPPEVSGCPPGDHCCFAPDGTVEDSRDRSMLANGSIDGKCTFSRWCTAVHTLTDFLPAVLIEEPAKKDSSA